MSRQPQGSTLVKGFAAEWTPRFQAVQEKLDSLPKSPGFADICIWDRVTGGVWSAGDVTRPGWTASTIKLAIAMDLLERGELSSEDESDLHAILHSSDNDATDRLWAKYGGELMLIRFRTGFGMKYLSFQPGFSETTYWRFVKCATEDLASLMKYILDTARDEHRKYLVNTMRSVSDTQRWGVWAAGEEMEPGVKNGWAEKVDSWGEHWLVRSVGFAGPYERYIVAVDYQMQSPGSLEDGVQATSDLVALLLGQTVPAQVSIPPD